MQSDKYEIVIIGAGPAGLAAAEVLAKNGREVLVFEKNKIIGKKVCGGGLSRKFLELNYPMKEIGDRFFDSVNYYYQEKKRKISAKSPLIVITEREKLGEYMANIAIKEGAKIRLDSLVERIEDGFVIVNGKKIYFDFLIGADGSNSIVRRFLNIPSKKFLFSLGYNIPKKYKNLEIFFDSKIFGDGYGAVFSHKDYTQIGITIDSNFYTIKEARKVLDNWIKKMKFNIKNGKFMAGVINYDYRGFQFGNKFLIGDAGGFASGLTGEGIFQAILSGREVAKKIINPDYNCPGIKHILTYKFLQERILKRLLGSKYQLISKIAFNIITLSARQNKSIKTIIKIVPNLKKPLGSLIL